MIVPFTDLYQIAVVLLKIVTYDNEKFINTYISGSKTEDDLSDLKDLNQSCSRTTEQMHSQETYEGFDFDKYWKMSADENDGYPYYFHVKQL